MADRVTKEQRSKNMAAVKAKDTKPELTVRKELHKRGFRYTLHNKKLPGTPDLYLRKYKTVIFVNGCFWHGHNCQKGKLPEGNKKFWQDKISKNTERDKITNENLQEMGIRCIQVWECQLSKKHLENTINNIENTLRA